MLNLRISIIGTSCSGKTTVAKLISEQLQIQRIELDALHWLPDWQERSWEEFITLVDAATDAEAWICDGNYAITRPIVWQRATHVIWLNYPFHVVFWRATKRTIARAWTKEELYSGNTESWKQSFFSKDSILLWVLNTYHKRRRNYRKLKENLSFPQLEFIDIHNQRELEHCLSNLKMLSNPK